MGTEKFFAFNESGELKRLKGRILRFLNSENPDNDDKAAIRASISVPASAEGLTPANNLSDLSSASDARDNIAVPSDDELAEAVARKLSAPSLYFDGSNDYIEIADSDKFTPSNGTDDLPWAITAWVNMDDATNFTIVSKFGASAASREWLFSVNGSDELAFQLRDTSGNLLLIESIATLSSYQGKWTHVAITYGGSGPNSNEPFSSGLNNGNAVLYINGEVQSATITDSVSYSGLSNTTQPVWIGGRQGAVYSKGHIADVRIHNHELTAAEVVDDMRGGNHFKHEWGGATATSGVLVTGKRYRLLHYISGDDFTNVGAGSNADGVEFTATGTTPTTWSNLSVVQNIGVLADFRPENFCAEKLIDLSSNNFIGINNGATFVGGRKAIQIDTDGAAAGNIVLTVYNGSSHLFYATDKGDLNVNSISSGASTELTIASGAVTVTKSYHTIDTESDDASDDLDTISGGRAGQRLVVQANNSTRTVVLKDGTGNLKLSGDISLDNAEDTAELISDGTNWYLLSTSNNGA